MIMDYHDLRRCREREKRVCVCERERIRKKGFLDDIIIAEHGKLRLEVQKWQKVFNAKNKKNVYPMIHGLAITSPH